jgi:hypothetical protein
MLVVVECDDDSAGTAHVPELLYVLSGQGGSGGSDRNKIGVDSA